MNIYLLEINTNPGLEESSPLISEIVPRMLDDALRLTVDVLFETKYCFSSNKGDGLENKEKENQEYQSPFPVKNYSDSENLLYW